MYACTYVSMCVCVYIYIYNMCVYIYVCITCLYTGQVAFVITPFASNASELVSR